MRKLKVSILALSVMAGGLIAASAYYDVAGKDYPLNSRFAGLPTNIVNVTGVPRILATDWIFGFPDSPGNGVGTVCTDGAGKIQGVGYTTLYLAGLTEQTNNYLAFVADVKGTVNTKGSGPSVKMTIKGNGYSKASAVYAAGPSINVTFTSSGALITQPAQRLSWTNQVTLTNWYGGGTPDDDAQAIVWTEKQFDSATTYTYTNILNGFQAGLWAAPDTPAPNATWDTGPVLVPVVYVDNDSYVELPGTVSGSYKTTTKNTVKLNKAAAVLSGASTLWGLDSGNFAQTLRGNGGVDAKHLDDYVQGQIINPGTKLYAASDFWSGKGTTSTKKLPGTYKLNLKGVCDTDKSTLNMNGNLGELIVDYLPINDAPAIVRPYYTNSVGTVYSLTNTDSGITRYFNSWGSLTITNPVYQTNIVLQGVRTIEKANGKVLGQKISNAQGVNVGAKFVQTINPTVFVPQPVEALFTANLTTVDAGQAVDFISDSTGDGPISYFWDFGDGVGTSDLADPTYTYAAPGDYTVTLTAMAPTSTNTLVRTNYITVGAGVSLGSAGTFAVLAGSAVTSTGLSVVNGDLGVSPGAAVTGFPPGLVNGAQHAGDAAAAQAQLDLTTAYDIAVGRTVGSIAKAGNLGGQTLTPGLYTSTSSLEISSGNLTLDAQGDPNAVFIFQMASTFTVTSGLQVILSGGAKAANVYWQVGSSATLGTTSTMRGNILAFTSITATTGAIVEGRLLARNGAVTLDTNAITVPAP